MDAADVDHIDIVSRIKQGKLKPSNNQLIQSWANSASIFRSPWPFLHNFLLYPISDLLVNHQS